MLRLKAKLLSAALALPMAAVVAFTGSPPASAAIDPGQIIGYVKQAYEAYKMLTKTDELTLDEATTRIINAVNAARTETINHIDQIAVDEVRACASAAVVDVGDIPQFSRDTQEAFARDTTFCVTQAATQISTVNIGGVDQLGFALNVVGPIALLARSIVGFSTGIEALESTLITANNAIVSRLNPSCSTRTEPYFDGRDKPVPSLNDNYLTCTAYNGAQGFDYAVGRIPPGGFNYSHAREQAMVRTSYPIAIASLSLLNG